MERAHLGYETTLGNITSNTAALEASAVNLRARRATAKFRGRDPDVGGETVKERKGGFPTMIPN